MEANPFTPTFGVVPARMAGREEVIGELSRSLERGVGDPGLVTVISGARGTGKTALLSLLADRAQASGWVAISVSALPGMLEEIVQQTHRAANHLLDSGAQSHISSVRLGDIVEVEIDRPADGRPTWRIRMADIFDKLAETDTGLLVTVDEVQPGLDEMINLASSFQHFVREGRNAALFMAGIPSHISGLLQNRSVSFLRRANYCELGPISDCEIRAALEGTAEDAGRSLTSEALDRAVEATAGFPYMMQLVGYRAWDQSPSEESLSLSDVEAGVVAARQDMRRKIFDVTFQELSRGDVRFLAAMIPDEGDSELASVAERMGKKSNYASQYKRRLIEQGVLIDCGQGYLRIGIPLFKDYLRERLG